LYINPREYIRELSFVVEGGLVIMGTVDEGDEDGEDAENEE